MFLIVEKHGNRSAADDDIADDTQKIRYLVQEEEAQQRCKDDLGIIKDGNFPCRCVGISGSDGELSAGSRKSGKKQENQLHQSHGVIGEQQIRQTYETRESGEEKDDKGSAFTIQAQLAYHCVGSSGTQTAQCAKKCRTCCQRRKSRFNDA